MKILIADDELVSRKKMDKLVRGLGHGTLVATDGIEAWDIWNSERPRMVITDWVMPGIDGLGLCRKIRKSEGSQYTYIIMVTSKSMVKTMKLLAEKTFGSLYTVKNYLGHKNLIKSICVTLS